MFTNWYIQHLEKHEEEHKTVLGLQKEAKKRKTTQGTNSQLTIQQTIERSQAYSSKQC
jgi:hypothetical protein